MRWYDRPHEGAQATLVTAYRGGAAVSAADDEGTGATPNVGTATAPVVAAGAGSFG